MEIRNTTIESFLKSFTFSFLLFVIWGYFCFTGIESLLKGFGFIQLLWVIYNVTITLLFLIRVRPAVVSMNPAHWIVALITSFSGFFFSEQAPIITGVLLFIADNLIIFAVLLGIMAAFILGRSYDFLPSLRHVKTRYLYKIVRHPMYLSSIIIKLGYVLKNPSFFNILLLAIVIILYDRRAKYEECVMSHDNSYVDYLQQVKYRFVPGIY